MLEGQRHKDKIAFVEQKCTRNISTNISTLGQRTHLKLGELSSLLRDNEYFYVDREQFLFARKSAGKEAKNIAMARSRSVQA